MSEQKVALVNNRLQHPIDFSQFRFTWDKFWEAMYHCRSKIAHGGDVDFSSAKLKPLGNLEIVMKILIETVKAIIRHALDEPQLLRDLRNC